MEMAHLNLRHLIFCIPTKTKKTIKYQGVKLFNALPDEILAANGIKSFRSRNMQQFLQQPLTLQNNMDISVSVFFISNHTFIIISSS